MKPSLYRYAIFIVLLAVAAMVTGAVNTAAFLSAAIYGAASDYSPAKQFDEASNTLIQRLVL